MNDFAADWLVLREAADTRARAARLTRAAVKACSGKSDLTVIDLGAGSGANLRFLAPRLSASQTWLLVDRDADLLRRAQSPGGAGPHVRVEPVHCELADVSSRLDFAQADLVTASALMDLVSAEWFVALAERFRRAAVPLLFVLVYDGRIEFQPQDPEDNLVRTLFNRDQRRDKGLGPALGPGASDVMRRELKGLGYDVDLAASDWILQPWETALQAALLKGYATAASHVDPDRSHRIAAWLARRQAFLADGTAHLRVGHRDLFADL